MYNHILLSVKDLEHLQVIPEHREWLTKWLLKIDQDINDGNISSSACLQGFLSEIVLYGKTSIDWLGGMEDYLTDENGYPLAYSEKFGKRLYNFDSQWKQSPIHAIHSRWFIENQCTGSLKAHYGEMVEQYIQTNGWIYNPSVSPTGIKTRMKSELTMSLAMGVEIMQNSNLISNDRRDFLCATLSSLPITGYIGAEYFRIKALRLLKASNLIPVGLEGLVKSCEAGKGYCDFSVNSKTDDYMGTVKRTERDKAIHSPLFSVFAGYIATVSGDEKFKKLVYSKLSSFGKHLEKEPYDIPSFRMRDIDIPFGTDLTPLEVICATFIINNF